MPKHQDPNSCTNIEEDFKKITEFYASISENNSNVNNVTSVKSLGKQQKDVTLEKVVRDMANVFFDLKNSISLIKSDKKKDSVHNIENELEKVYKKQEEINRKKEEEEKKKAEIAQIAAANKAKQQKKPNSANNNNQARQNGPIKNQNRLNKPHTPQNRNKVNLPTRPSTAPSGKPNGTQVFVANLKFPPENQQNINAKSATVKGSANQVRNRQNSSTPSLRKPSPNISNKRVVSVPPPREIYNPLGIIKDEVDRAIRDKKTFTIKGHFPAVRRSLLKRGWIEKYHTNYRERLNDDIKRYQQLSVGELVDLLRNKDLVETVRKMIKSKLLKENQVDLYWDHTYDAFRECSDSKKLTLINRFRRESFSYTSKQGLCQAAREAHWLQIPGVARINHPRCYVLAKGGDTKTFLKDFGLTAAVSLLKWVVKNNITGEYKIVSETGKIPMKVFDFAIAECYKFIKQEKHQDIDEEIRDALEIEWNEFLEQYYKTVHIGNHFKLADKTVHPNQEAKDMVRKANYLLNQLREYMPCMDMDGYMNIWILKPTNSSRGEGIHICRTLKFILDTVKKNPNRRYVIQKYIERPLLIHETKFDIRQWFLVSSSYPLIIWMYKLCYLRFSSQTYNLRKLHESIHLTNNSVQAKYLQHGSVRDPLLPSYGMWDSKQFKSFLSDIGYPTIFEDVIYPGMKQCITGAMIAHRDKIDKRQNCFEIYGADFMLSENFEPWMLEINSNPALHASTPVTAKLCPEVLEDVIKVVVDNARNPRASTGDFELIYKEKLDSLTPNTKEKLEVTGTPIPEDYFCDITTNERPQTVSTVKKFQTPDPGKILLQTGETMKEALKNLLEIVKREKLKRRSRREKCIEAKLGIEDSSNLSPSEVVPLFQSAMMSKISSDHSETVLEFSSQEKLTEDESRQVTEVLSEIKSLHNKKQVFSSLVKVVDTLRKARKLSKCKQ